MILAQEPMTTAQIATLIVSICSLLGLGTIMTLFWNDKHSKKKKQLEQQSDEHKFKEKHDRESEMIEMARPIVQAINDKIDGINDRLDHVDEKIDSRIDALENKIDHVGDGTLSGLRNSILTCYYKCVEKKYRNDYDYQNMHHMYDSYKDLNGNSYVEDIMTRFDDLPTKEEYEAQIVARANKKKASAKKAKKVLVEDKDK